MFLTRSASDDDLLKGKSVAILLFYTGCQDVCPLETANLVQVQKLLGERMGKDIFFYSIAIDPWDTPKENKAYAKKFGVEPGWSFLSGKETDISLIARKLGLSRASDAVSKDGHSASLMVGNVDSGMWMRNSALDAGEPGRVAALRHALRRQGRRGGARGPLMSPIRFVTRQGQPGIANVQVAHLISQP